MEKKSIKKFVSGVLGFAVQDWDSSWHDADVQGKLTASHTNRIILEICKRIEAMEATDK